MGHIKNTILSSVCLLSLCFKASAMQQITALRRDNNIEEDRIQLLTRLTRGLNLKVDVIKKHQIHLKEKSFQITDEGLREGLVNLLDSLKSPEDGVWRSKIPSFLVVLGERTPSERGETLKEKIRNHPVFVILNDRIKKLQAFAVEVSAFATPLLALSQTYENFIETFVSTLTLDEAQKAFEPKVKLFGTHLRPSFIEKELAYRLICKTPLGIVPEKENESGGHHVTSCGGVHFKVYNEAHSLYPGRELAMHHLYKLLIGEGVAPTTLLYLEDIPMFKADREDKIRKIILQNAQDKKPYTDLVIQDPDLDSKVKSRTEKESHSIQAAFSIDGVGIDAVGFDKFLEYVEFASWLRDNPDQLDNPENYFLDQNGSIIKGDNSRFRFMKRFFRPITKAADENLPREIDEVKWANFFKDFNPADWSFENLDEDNVAKMVLMSFITEPGDAKADNFMVYKENRATSKWKVISIDSDIALEAEITKITRDEPVGEHLVEHKCIFYLLPSLMNRPVPFSVKEQFKTLKAPLILAKWLICLEDENAAYEKLQGESSLPKSIFKHMELPIKFKRGRINLLLSHIESLQSIFTDSNESLTLDQVFKLLHPVLYAYYNKMQVLFPNNPLGAMGEIYKDKKATVERIIGDEELSKVQEGTSLKDRLQEFNVPTQTETYQTGLGREHQLRQEHNKIHRLQSLEKTFRELDDEIEARKNKNMQDRTVPRILNLQELILEAGTKRDLSKTENNEIVDLLIKVIRLQGPRTVDPSIGRQFYQRCLKKSGLWRGRPYPDKELREAWIGLLMHNSKLAWYCGVDDFFLTDVELRQLQTSQLHKATGAVEREKYFTEGAWNQLFDENGSFIKINANNAQAVGKATINGVTFYFKRFPDGIEEAIGRLKRQLMRFGAPHVELFRIENTLYLVSQAVEGLTITETLARFPERLQNLDPESLGNVFLMNMLIPPENGNASNYILERMPAPPQGSALYRLIRVDNDLALDPSQADTEQGVQVKSILYCMDQMQEPIHAAVRERFTAFNPLFELQKWLNEIKQVHRKQVALFKNAHDERKLLQSLFKKYNCFIGFAFKKWDLHQIYDRFVRLQDALHDSEVQTYWDLLLLMVDPDIAQRYQTVLNDSPGDAKDIYERFKKVDSAYSDRVKDRQYSIKQALTELEQEADGRAEQLATERADFELLVSSFASGAQKDLKGFESDGFRNKFFKNLDFNRVKKLSTPIPLSELAYGPMKHSAQKKLLELLLPFEHHKIWLLNCTALTDSIFPQRFKIKGLTHLTLRGCPNVTSSMVSVLPQACPLLVHLDLTNSPSLDFIGNQNDAKSPRLFQQLEQHLDIVRGGRLGNWVISDGPCALSHLRRLILNGCPNLRCIFGEFPVLSSISVKDCSRLMMIRGSMPSLIRANLSYTKKLSAEEIISFDDTHPNLKEFELNAAVHVRIGVLYERGQGVPLDYATAMKWYQNAAAQGDAYAQNSIGNLYFCGYGVPRDYAEAMKWFKQAAAQGHAPAQFNIGVLHDMRLGIPQDYVKAMKWYQKAADQGYAHAQNSIGVLYYMGLGVRKNYEEAKKWFKQAAAQGDAHAQNSMGNLYDYGYGVEVNYEKAMKWYRKAADQGDAHAQNNLKSLLRRLEGYRPPSEKDKK